MANESKDSRSRRICRNGCGVEQNSGKGDTPGFPSLKHASITRDPRGHKKFNLPRPSSKHKNTLIQSSIYLSQSWRANCDFQLLYYESGNEHPSPDDIARVTDYIVAYACKGIESMQQEKEQIKSLILSAKCSERDQTDVKRLACQIFNRSIGQKLISKQECMVQLAGLPLYICSENIEDVSLSK